MRERKCKRKAEGREHEGDELLMESLGRCDPLKLAKCRLRIVMTEGRRKKHGTSLVSNGYSHILKIVGTQCNRACSRVREVVSMAWLMLIFFSFTTANPLAKLQSPPLINFAFIFYFYSVWTQLLLVPSCPRGGGAKYGMSGYQFWLSLAVVRVCRYGGFEATGLVSHDDWCLKRRTKKESSTAMHSELNIR